MNNGNTSISCETLVRSPIIDSPYVGSLKHYSRDLNTLVSTSVRLSKHDPLSTPGRGCPRRFMQQGQNMEIGHHNA